MLSMSRKDSIQTREMTCVRPARPVNMTVICGFFKLFAPAMQRAGSWSADRSETAWSGGWNQFRKRRDQDQFLDQGIHNPSILPTSNLRRAAPAHPPLSYPRHRKRQLPLQKQIGQSRQADKEQPNNNLTQTHHQAGLLLDGNPGSVLSGNRGRKSPFNVATLAPSDVPRRQCARSVGQEIARALAAARRNGKACPLSSPSSTGFRATCISSAA